MLTIGQVMNKNVATIPAEATVGEAINFLTKLHTGGAPVVDGDGKLIGVISELQLIDVVFDPAVKDRPVTHYMTEEVQSVGPEEPLSRAAQLFALYAFRRLPVVENGKVIGVFTRRDLMNHALRTSKLLTDPLLEIFPELNEIDNSREPSFCFVGTDGEPLPN
jgi:CBS domain-containing protein